MIAIILDDVSTDLDELVAHYKPTNRSNCMHCDWQHMQEEYGSVLACVTHHPEFYYRHNGATSSYLHMNDWIRHNGRTEIMCMTHWRRTIKQT